MPAAGVASEKESSANTSLRKLGLSKCFQDCASSLRELVKKKYLGM
jgi:hypothetical protein